MKLWRKFTVYNHTTFLFVTSAAPTDLPDLLKPVLRPKRTDGATDLCAQLVLWAALALFRARERLANSAETYEERRERRRPLCRGAPYKMSDP